jgi:3-hydroxyacyl-CoA dehydrogenase
MKEIKNFVVLEAGAMGAQIATLAAEAVKRPERVVGTHYFNNPSRLDGLTIDI